MDDSSGGDNVASGEVSCEPLRLLLLGEGGGGSGTSAEASARRHAVIAGLLRELKRAAEDDAREGGGRSVAPPSTEIVDVSEAGHGDEAVRNLLTGTCDADAALLIVDADRAALRKAAAEGSRTQEHILLVAALGIRHLAVCVHGLGREASSDMCDDQLHREVQYELSAILEFAGFNAKEVPFVPTPSLDCSAASPGTAPPAWYSGPTLVAALTQARRPPDLSARPLRVPLHEVYRIRSAEVVSVGRVEMGTLREGARLTISPEDVPICVGCMEVNGRKVPVAQVGETVRLVGMTQGRSGKICFEPPPVQAGVGHVVSEVQRDPTRACVRFLAELVVLRDPPKGQIRTGYRATLDVHTAHVPCAFVELRWRRGGGPTRVDAAPAALSRGDVAEAWLEPLEPVCLEVFSFCPPLGRFTMRHQEATVAAGIVKEVHRGAARTACFDD